jgi:multicomponent Na+:H+ antiporter subunit E
MNWLILIGVFLVQLVRGALSVALRGVSSRLDLHPALIDYPLTVHTDAQITLLANLITLTPGTLSVDVSDNRKTLRIHVLDAPDDDAVIGHIAAGFETRVLRVLR